MSEETKESWEICSDLMITLDLLVMGVLPFGSEICSNYSIEGEKTGNFNCYVICLCYHIFILIT